jgi:hypothetical protein
MYTGLVPILPTTIFHTFVRFPHKCVYKILQICENYKISPSLIYSILQVSFKKFN